MKEKKNRIYSLDLLRFGASICIVFHHYQQLLNVSFERGIDFYGGIFRFDTIVELFFLLSGMLAAEKRKDIPEKTAFPSYIGSRMLRLLPLCAIAAVVFEILVAVRLRFCPSGRPFIGAEFVNLWGMITDMFGVQNGWCFINPAINNPTWYISVLLLCHVFLYFLTWLAHRLKIPAAYPYAVMIFWGLGIYFYGINLPFMNASAARGYYAFFFGVLLGMWLEKHRDPDGNVLLSRRLVLLSVAILLLFGLLLWKAPVEAQLNQEMTCTFLIYPAILLLLRMPLFSRLFTFRILGVLGKVSYDMYIWHVPLLLAVVIANEMFGLALNFGSPLYMLGFAAFVFLFGLLSHFLIDEPIQKKVASARKEQAKTNKKG